MKNIHVLPTDKPSRLGYLTKKGKEVFKDLRLFDKPMPNILDSENQHIYITSDEELVLGGYHFNSKYGDEPQKTNQRDIDSRKYWEEEDYYITKVILTTDQDLIADGVQAIDDEFLEWFVKNPSCESVVVNFNYKKFRWSELNKSQCYKIIIPQEEPKQETLTYTEAAKKEERIFNSTMVSKQETLEEAAYRLSAEKFEPNHIGFMLGVIEGAKWQQEQDKNKYSEEEVLNIIADCDGSVTQAKKWFEQFKKK